MKASHNKRLKRWALLGLPLIAGTSLYFAQTPILEHIIRTRLEARIPALPEAYIGRDYIRYSNIALDREGVNTIEELTFVKTAFTLFNGNFKTIVIKKPELYFSTQEQDLSQKSIMAELVKNRDLLRLLKAKEIALQQGDISIITNDYGTLSTTLNLTATQSETNGYALQARFNSRQKFISVSGTLSGQITSKMLDTNIEIERGKIDLPDKALKLTRTSGWGNINITAHDYQFLGELRSGGVDLANLPWHNASITYRHIPNLSEFYLSAQSIGTENIELNLSIDSTNGMETAIIAPSKKSFHNYLNANGYQSDKDKSDLQKRLNAKIELQQ